MSYRNVLVIGFSLILATLLLHFQETHGKEFLVGDEKGWRQYPGLSDWPNGKKFTPGDILVFKYDNTSNHILRVEFNRPGFGKMCYENCDPSPCVTTIYDSGNDRILLRDGENFFLSSSHETCIQGLKLTLCAEFAGKRKTCV